MRQIEKLESYSTSKDGINWCNHPTKQDIEEKINEIIDVVNSLTVRSNRSLEPPCRRGGQA